ncbi:hypothetical protein BKA93DRAFT_760152 [Sparassis latifolia]
MTHNATIHDLPDDVLLLIFKAVYSMSRKYPGRDNRSVSIFEADKNDVIWQDEDVSSPSNLFPDSLVPMCRLWKDTLSSVSAFWTRLVIFVDERPTPLSAITSRLALAAERALEIKLTRRHGSWPDADLSEQARVNAVISFLSAHMSRWKTLRLDVLHSSSVPRPHVAMHGDAANLVDLRLHSRLKDAPLLAYCSSLVIQATDDSNRMPTTHILETDIEIGPPLTVTTNQRHINQQLRAPRMSELQLDGVIFFASYSCAPVTWMSVRKLTVTHCVSPPSGMFTANMLLTCLNTMPSLRELTLVEVALEFYEEAMPALVHCGLQRCTFVDIPEQMLAALVGLLQNSELTSLTVKRCSMRRWAPGQWPLSSLTLEGINKSDDVLEALRAWPPRVLTVENCAGFDKIILAALADPYIFTCPGMQVLELSDCQGISSRELRMMIEGRQGGIGDDDAVDPDVGFISTLRVTGCGELDPNDKVFFQEHAFLRQVEWDGQMISEDFESDVDSVGWARADDFSDEE